MRTIKDDIIEYTQKPLPVGLNIVEQSVPICFFGKIETAKIATIGINPAPDAFSSNPTLPGRKDFSVRDNDYLSIEHAEMVYKALLTYFDRPYHRFFKRLETFVAPVFNCHYLDGTMVHLDIVPWATKSYWTNISDKKKQVLIEEYKGLFVRIIKENDIKLFFVNGKAVKNQLQEVLKLDWEDKKIKTGKNNTTVSIAQKNGKTFLASSRFTSNDHLKKQDREQVQQAMREFLGKSIKNIEKSISVIKNNPSEAEINKTNRDYHKILVGDDYQPFFKNRSVLEAIRIYCAKNSGIAYSGLREAFPDRLQVQRYGVVRLLEEIPNNYRRRYFVNSEELIHLDSGEVVAVCNQWGSGINYEKFFYHANKMGIKMRYKEV